MKSSFTLNLFSKSWTAPDPQREWVRGTQIAFNTKKHTDVVAYTFLRRRARAKRWIKKRWGKKAKHQQSIIGEDWSEWMRGEEEKSSSKKDEKKFIRLDDYYVCWHHSAQAKASRKWSERFFFSSSARVWLVKSEGRKWKGKKIDEYLTSNNNHSPVELSWWEKRERIWSESIFFILTDRQAR